MLRKFVDVVAHGRTWVGAVGTVRRRFGRVPVGATSKLAQVALKGTFAVGLRGVARGHPVFAASVRAQRTRSKVRTEPKIGAGRRWSRTFAGVLFQRDAHDGQRND